MDAAAATPATHRSSTALTLVSLLLPAAILPCHRCPATASRALGDPVEHDAEQDDRDARGQALAEVLALGEPGDDVVA